VLIIQSCYKPDEEWAPNVSEICERTGSTCGFIERSYTYAGRGRHYYNQYCAKSVADVCKMIKCAKPAPFSEIIVYGHCGGPELGAENPGISFGTGKPRFDATSLNVKCFLAIEQALAKDGVLTLCSCGYRPASPDDAKKWDQSLQEMANYLGRTVCACPGVSNLSADEGCICVGGAKPVCKSPEKEK